MSSIFCCDAINPYRPQYLSHQTKFNSFMSWASIPRASLPRGNNDETGTNLDELSPQYAVQLVQQINYGALESKRYFVPTDDRENEFFEVKEDDLIKANFKKLNTYKNYRCNVHNKFFEVNIYQKDPFNAHHWRVNLARPANLIDL